jgi:sec-independent protein translocase protein TatA
MALIDLGSSEMVLIAVIALILFGGKKMPEFARGLGKAIREFKKATGEVEREIKRVIDEAEHTPPPRVIPPPDGTPEKDRARISPGPG